MATCNPNAQNGTAASSREESLKLALAISLVRSKLINSQKPPPPPLPEPSSGSDALRWKRKVAKDRKQEIIRLREDLKEAEDASSKCDLFPQTAACKCYLFDDLGKLRSEYAGDGSDSRFKDVLRRRFFRQVRTKQRRRKRDNPNLRLRFPELNSEDEVDQFRASVDFLVELCDGTASPAEEAHFANWSHQAVDFILESLKKILQLGEKIELIEGIVSSLIMRLLRRICSPSQRDDASHAGINYQSQVQHLLRKLGTESFIGQRILLSISERVSTIAENLLCMDPFGEAFPNIHRSLYIMIQLIEFLISDYVPAWSSAVRFDTELLEEWVTSFLHARKALQLLESRHGLYVLYMDRVANELAKQACYVSPLQKLNQQLLQDLFN
ncbi:Protein MULTIPOLAR SPINDLE 1 [Linum perenne]